MTSPSRQAEEHCPDCGRPVEPGADLCACGFPLMFLRREEPERAVLKPSRRPTEDRDDTDELPVVEAPPPRRAASTAPSVPVDGIVCASCDEVNPSSRTWCAQCGAALRERRDLTEVLVAGPPSPPRRRALLVGGAIAAVVVVAGAAALARGLLRGDSQDGTAGRATVLAVKGVQASRTASDSKESVAAGKRTVTYEAKHVIDGDPATAWRVGGSGVGEFLDLTLDRERLVTRVALVPGYAKIDPGDNTDRFAQNGAVTEVRWIFDGEVERVQRVEDPQARMTDFEVEPPVKASNIRLRIAASRPGTKTVQPTTAISEVEVTGR